jgi:hypothetical protein
MITLQTKASPVVVLVIGAVAVLIGNLPRIIDFVLRVY